MYRTNKRYKILYPKGVKDSMSPEVATKTILEGIELDPEQYRLGHTKVYYWEQFFRLTSLFV